MVLLSCLPGCDSAGERSVPDYSNCRYQKPEPIFYADLPQLSDYHFGDKGEGTEESFTLSGEIQVSISQYGCNYRSQEFVFGFDRQGICENSEDCTQRVAQMLQALARLGPEFHVFRAWGRAIKEVASEISFGESYQLTEGFWVAVDHRERNGDMALMLTLSEKP